MIIVQVAGRLGKDAESRFTPSGQKVTTLTLATNVRKGGKDETVWWRVTVWGDRYDKMMPYLKKGSALIVVGEMNKPDIWTDKEGRSQVSLEITAEIIRFSPFGGGTEKSNQEQGGAGQSMAQGGVGAGVGAPDYGVAQGGNGGTGGGYGANPAASRYTQPSAENEEPLPF